MWRNGQELQPGVFQPDEGKALSADSKCIFGISKRPPSLAKSAMQINAFFDGRNYMMLSAPGDRLYWFLFQDMDKKSGSDIPRFTKQQETELAEALSSDQVCRTTTFGEIYENRLHTALVSIEEHIFPRWHFQRIITIGDAAHKVHPNTAQGGNGAIETSAVLFNSIKKQLEQDPKMSSESIETAFADVHSNRIVRAENALKQGRGTSALSTKDTIAARIFVHFVMPWFGDRLIMWLSIKHAETGPVVEGKPLPVRHGVTLPHSGTVKEPGSVKTQWALGAFGVTAVAAFAIYARSQGWTSPPLALLKGLSGSP